MYLVGGAVRDMVLGIQPKDLDYVVVGATPEQMIRMGYEQVGASFPVFIKNGHEYALARTERKTGHGHTAFETVFDTSITLEQDLSRRDFTINAMARTVDGTVIDPFGGQIDLHNRVIRHVSDAFSEDPLRVLRAARFAARYHNQGFTIAPETMLLMSEMVNAGELNHLTPERVWKELHGALLAPKPSVFIRILHHCGALRVVLPELDALYGVPQNATWHPEIDTGIHTEMVVDVCRTLTDDPVTIFASLVHDLGKALTPRDEWPAHRLHEQTGLVPVEAVCDRLRVPNDYKRVALMVCREHLKIHRIAELKHTTLHDLIATYNGLQRVDDIDRLAVACEADKRGRLGMEHQPYPQATMLRAALAAMRSVTFANLPTHDRDGSPINRQGSRIGEDLRRLRIAAIKRSL